MVSMRSKSKPAVKTLARSKTTARPKAAPVKSSIPAITPVENKPEQEVVAKAAATRRKNIKSVNEKPEAASVTMSKFPVIADALYFDAEWYLSTYPDVAAAGIDAASHYSQAGFREGRNPNSVFKCEDYLAANPDLAGYDGDPFLHYIFFGAAEGRPLKSE